jgi:hypothetical protein
MQCAMILDNLYDIYSHSVQSASSDTNQLSVLNSLVPAINFHEVWKQMDAELLGTDRSAGACCTTSNYKPQHIYM